MATDLFLAAFRPCLEGASEAVAHPTDVKRLLRRVSLFPSRPVGVEKPRCLGSWRHGDGRFVAIYEHEGMSPGHVLVNVGGSYVLRTFQAPEDAVQGPRSRYDRLEDGF